MRNSENRRKDASKIDGDAMPPFTEKVSSGGLTTSSSDDDTFLFGYGGHYGDPHSFAPYQLVLLLIDFIFNWTMDLTHEDPLAVLVIFVFQSLAIIINLILYIMASANRAMQVGLHKRVTIHHWLNLAICLLYMGLTAWWFIWALRKSWPSVSDQFSFTWPAAGLPALNGTLPPSVNNSAGRMNGNATRRITAAGKNGGTSASSLKSPENEVVDHLSLWSNGFIALYVCHRVTAIFYYFIYLRATFLVLNTPDIDKFLDKKNKLVEKFWEVKKAEKEENILGNGRKRRNVVTNSYGGGDGPPQRSTLSLGLNEYLAAGSAKFLLDTEAGVGGSRYGGDAGGGRGESRGKSNKKRQILWADDDEDGVMMKGEGEVSGGGSEIEEEEPKKSLGVRKAKALKKSRRRRSDDKDDDLVEEEQSRAIRHHRHDKGDDGDEDENLRKAEKPRPRERTKQRRRASREEIEDYIED